MRRVLALLGFFWLAFMAAAADPSHRFVYPGNDGKLVYDTDDAGNRIPDFSHAGYGSGGTPIPDVPVRVVVSPGKADNTARIQAATDADLLAAIPRLKPFDWAAAKGLPDGQYALADPGRDYLVFTPSGAVRLDLSDQTVTFAPHWVDLKSGACNPEGDPVPGGKAVEFQAPGKGAAVLWLTKK